MKLFAATTLALFTSTASLMGGCATKQQTGAVAGAGLGAAAGGAIGDEAGAVVGGLIGAFVGSEIGRSMDEYDRRQALLALEQTPTGRTTVWQNPDTGNQYRVTPTQTYQYGDRPCREFRMQAEVAGGGVEDVYGTACRAPDGSWEIVST